MATKKTTSEKVEKKKIVCANGCSKTPKALNNFYKSTRDEYELHDSYCTTCKDCLRRSTIDSNLNTVTMDSIRDALKKLDKPLIESVFTEVKNLKDKNGNSISNGQFLGKYITQLNLYAKYKDSRYSDTVDIQIEQEKIMNSKVEEVKQHEVTDEMIRFWGRNASLGNQDYLDLQAMFDSFTKQEETMDYKKESDYKQLCKYELQKSKIEFDISSIAAVEKLQKMIDTLSDNLGIQAIQKQDSFDNNKFVLGLIGRYYEDIKKKPIKRWVEDLGNIDPLRDIIRTDYLGGMAAALGVSSPEIEEARKRMEEFSVKLEEVYDDEEDD